MLSLSIIFTILICHYLFDFVCQTNYMANNKSKSFRALVSHTCVYSLLWILPMLFFLPREHLSIFILSTFILHTLTDYITSRITSALYNAKKYRLFFNVIGIDQLLHYTQLILTYYYLCQKN